MFSNQVLLTRPMNLKYEQFIFDYYLQILEFIQEQLNRVATLEQDLEILKSCEQGVANPPISF